MKKNQNTWRSNQQEVVVVGVVEEDGVKVGKFLGWICEFGYTLHRVACMFSSIQPPC
jgi:hypothetical protein